VVGKLFLNVEFWGNKMDLVILESNGIKTMLSIDMVSYINSQRKESEPTLAHSDFLKKVPKVLGEEAAGKYSASYKDRSGKLSPCYSLPKREACLMAMSYSYELQAKVFDRWQELEAQQSQQLPQTYIGALEALIESEKAKEALVIENKEQAEQIKAAAPALKFVADFTVSKGDVSLRQAAKELSQSPMAFNRQLAELGMIYKLGDTWTAKQTHINAGRFAMKAILCDDGEHRAQCTVTPKGLAYISEKLEELNAGVDE
jgi:phage antirepressor YoqD-like protein